MKPTSLEELLILKSKFPDSRLVFGNTLFEPVDQQTCLAAALIPELRQLKLEDSKLIIGSAVTLSRLREWSREILDGKCIP